MTKVCFYLVINGKLEIIALRALLVCPVENAYLFRNEMDTINHELSEVKQSYVHICAEKDNMEENLKLRLESVSFCVAKSFIYCTMLYWIDAVKLDVVNCSYWSKFDV